MKQVRIALSGSHGTGKTWIMDGVQNALELNGIVVGRVESPTRFIKSLGFKNNEDSGFETQLLSGTERVVRQRKVALDPKVQVVLADRCLVDELAYNEYLQEQLDVCTDDGFYANRDLQLCTDVLEKFLYSDVIVNEYWDTIYYKPLHQDFPPEDDGDRSTALNFWHRIDEAVPALMGSYGIEFSTLPPDRTLAVDVVLTEVLLLLS